MKQYTFGVAFLLLLVAGCAPTTQIDEEEGDEHRTEAAFLPWPEAEAPETDFTPLFNGLDLDGWTAEPGTRFGVKEGAIVVEEGKGLLSSHDGFQDFELRAEFRFPVAAADSGIFFRVGETRYQVQTKDAVDLGEIRSAKVTQVHDREATNRLRKPPGQWQSFDILVRGSECWVKLNGETVTYASALVEQSGPIAIQAEGYAVEFRNLRVRKLK